MKPFAFSELLARMRTLLRRAPEREPDVLRLADLEVDVRTRRVTRAGRPLSLTPNAVVYFRVVAHFMLEELRANRHLRQTRC